uniref:Uncharacterized protein n=1 Tax=Siphoviridae sp. ct7EW56 TaxID=2827562 RepID=A0A8S5LRX9_9CAUD|nr:MAG TPA: hypothetical protein [Siphoviridae sp. ct7EW56]
MDDEELKFCHAYDDADVDCLDYMECEECPYYYSDDD